MFSRFRTNFGRFDWLLFLATIVLLTISIATIWSVALSRDPGNLGTVIKQGVAATIGLILIFSLSVANYRLFKNYALILVLTALFLLIGVLVFGETIRGTRGWLSIAGWNFQPVEFVKFVLIVFLAKYLSDHPRAAFGMREFIVSSCYVALFVGLVLLQPDLGSALILLSIWVGMLAFARIRKRYILFIICGALVTIVTAWFFLAPYQKDRILTFIDPNRDPLGRGYNVTQAVIAVGAGEFTGRGLGFGSQSQLRFLPESQTDFIFAVIAEELGFAGVTLVLVFLGILLSRLLFIAKSAPDDFTVFLALGIFIAFAVECTVNIGMNLGLMPVTGIALPFLSYGGSALLLSLFMVGVVQSIAVHRPLQRTR